MKYDVKAFELLSNEEIADGIFDMRVKNDELAPLAKCGQFAHVYVPSKTLRRPISVCDSENGVLRLVYQVKGEGTKIMSEMKKGEAVDILAPLGNGVTYIVSAAFKHTGRKEDNTSFPTCVKKILTSDFAHLIITEGNDTMAAENVCSAVGKEDNIAVEKETG